MLCPKRSIIKIENFVFFTLTKLHSPATFDTESVSPNHLSSHLELPKVTSSNLQAHHCFLNSPSLTPFPYPVRIALKSEEFCVVGYAAAGSLETSVNWYQTTWCDVKKQHSTYHIYKLDVCLSVHRCICVEKKNQLDATEWFIALIIHSPTII